MMACNRKMVYRYNSYATRKIPYIKMLIGIKIVKLFKQLLSIVYRGKERTKYQLIPAVKSTKELGKVKAYKTKKSQQ